MTGNTYFYEYFDKNILYRNAKKIIQIYIL